MFQCFHECCSHALSLSPPASARRQIVLSNHRVLHACSIPGVTGFTISHPSGACHGCILSFLVFCRFSPVFLILFSLSQSPSSTASWAIFNVICAKMSISYQNRINHSKGHWVHCRHSPTRKVSGTVATFGRSSENGQMRRFRYISCHVILLSYHGSGS